MWPTLGHMLSLLGLLTVLKLSSSKQSIDCTKESSCKCRTKDGKVIDLSPLANTDNTPRFKNINGGSDQFAWNPCNDFTLSEDTSGTCVGVAACQTHFDGGLPMYYSIGTQNTAAFVNDPSRGLELQYTASDPFTPRTSYVGLECDENEEGKLTATGEDPPKSANYYMTLKSKYCCPSGGVGPTGTPSGGGLSVGTVLLIIFLSLLFVYLIAGVIFMKFVRNAQGREMIPNEPFWSSLPGFIRDGIRFLFIDRCRGGTYAKV